MKSKKTVFVSGGTRGIGRQIVELFALNGYNVAFCYKNSKEKADEIVEQLIKKEVNVLALKCDVSSYESVYKMHKQIKEHFGGVDVIVNNAAVSHSRLFGEETIDSYNDVMGQNFGSVFNVCNVFLDDLLQKKDGKIINISSIWGIEGASMEVLYSASKAAVIGFTRALAQELAPSNICVNAVAAGFIDTDMNKNLSTIEREEFIKSIPLLRAGQASEVAECVLFLASSSYITGEVIRVSGGL